MTCASANSTLDDPCLAFLYFSHLHSLVRFLCLQQITPWHQPFQATCVYTTHQKTTHLHHAWLSKRNKCTSCLPCTLLLQYVCLCKYQLQHLSSFICCSEDSCLVASWQVCFDLEYESLKQATMTTSLNSLN